VWSNRPWGASFFFSSFGPGRGRAARDRDAIASHKTRVKALLLSLGCSPRRDRADDGFRPQLNTKPKRRFDRTADCKPKDRGYRATWVDVRTFGKGARSIFSLPKGEAAGRAATSRPRGPWALLARGGKRLAWRRAGRWGRPASVRPPSRPGPWALPKHGRICRNRFFGEGRRGHSSSAPRGRVSARAELRTPGTLPAVRPKDQMIRHPVLAAAGLGAAASRHTRQQWLRPAAEQGRRRPLGKAQPNRRLRLLAFRVDVHHCAPPLRAGARSIRSENRACARATSPGRLPSPREWTGGAGQRPPVGSTHARRKRRPRRKNHWGIGPPRQDRPMHGIAGRHA